MGYIETNFATKDFRDLAKDQGAAELVDGCNEWRLFHGSSLTACNGICKDDFAVNLAGSGATWKDPGKNAGTPLYGYGIYLAERITKADEYAKPHGPDGDLYSVLVPSRWREGQHHHGQPHRHQPPPARCNPRPL